MRPGGKIIAAMTGLALSAMTAQAAFSLNFASMAGSTIQFNGAASAFQVNNNIAGNQWWITSGGTGAALGKPGWFGGGPWSYGPITVSGVDQWATVTTPGGNFTINDGAGFLATGNVTWVKVSTHEKVGGVNANLAVNISGMVYNGLNPDLQTLVAASKGEVILTFQFNPGKTLTDLTTGVGPYTTSYSGSFTPVPEPSTILGGLGALGLLLFGIARGKH